MKKDNLIQEFLSLVNVEDFDSLYNKDIVDGKYFGMPLEKIIKAEKRLLEDKEPAIGYFSMEYGLATSFYNKFLSHQPIVDKNKIPESEVFSNFRLSDYFFSLRTDNIIDLPIYSGGLGVLAGDTIKTMADYKLPAVCIGMLWHSGYFRQRFWFKYGQAPDRMQWDMDSYPGLIPLKNRIKISLRNQDLYLKLWKYYVYSYKHDYAVPLILLDANIKENDERSRSLTEQLYRADDVWIKVLQRVILGFGGVVALRELGYNINKYHLNEGHAVFAFIEKAREDNKPQEIEKLKEKFVYTCHTPVEAGHDRFSPQDLKNVLKNEDYNIAEKYGMENGNTINLTLLSMNIASSINAVSRNHQKVMHLQFPAYKERIKYVTNGVHPYTWISESFMKLYKAFPDVLENIEANPMILSKANALKGDQEFRHQLWNAHQVNKERLCNLLEKWNLQKDVFTICWARRLAAYKRPSLILHDVDRLIKMSKSIGRIQIIIAGKAHPSDNLGRANLNEILDKIDASVAHYDYLKIIALENYDISMAKILTCGSDVWLNNPLPPFEASGTSGMKAILNGVIQMSTLDGWVAEAEDKNIGIIFGYRNKDGDIGTEYNLHLHDDSEKLYKELEEILKLYYKTNRDGKIDYKSSWMDTMINCIAAGAYFNTYRMLDEYKHIIWGIK